MSIQATIAAGNAATSTIASNRRDFAMAEMDSLSKDLTAGEERNYWYPLDLSDSPENQCWILFSIYDSLVNTGMNEVILRAQSNRLRALSCIADIEPGTIAQKATGNLETDAKRPIASRIDDYILAFENVFHAAANVIGVTDAGPGSSDRIDEDVVQKEMGGGSRTIGALTTIGLFMPSALTATYGTNYDQQNFNFITAVRKIVESIKQTNSTPTLNLAPELIREFGTKFFAETIDSVLGFLGAEVNVAGTIESTTRAVSFGHPQFLFKSVDARQFAYSFTMTARNPQEAKMIFEIIRTFKYYAMPKISVGSRFLQYPAEFEIQYFVGGKENIYLPRQGRAVLQKVDVDYGTTDKMGGAFSIFEPFEAENSILETPAIGKYQTSQEPNLTFGVPQQIQLTLNFQETTTLHRGLIDKGY